MKLSLLFPFLSVILLMASAPLPAQTTDDAETPPPAGETVIDSDILHSDQTAHISIFTGNVVVLGTNFKMTCQEMTVYFTTDNKVDHIVATGDVVITQPDRITHCGHAEYFRDTDMFVLTDQPVIVDHKNTVSGPEIDIYRTTQKMVVKGRSNVILSNESMGSPQPPPPPPPPSTDNSTDTK
jgi:lipopolysaccharide transport protein LptA